MKLNIYMIHNISKQYHSTLEGQNLIYNGGGFSFTDMDELKFQNGMGKWSRALCSIVEIIMHPLKFGNRKMIQSHTLLGM